MRHSVVCNRLAVDAALALRVNHAGFDTLQVFGSVIFNSAPNTEPLMQARPKKVY
jgi:hypothetical protein